MKEYYCPHCKRKLEVLDGWGSISYYCQECNMIISRKKILTKEEICEEENKWYKTTYTNKGIYKHL